MKFNEKSTYKELFSHDYCFGGCSNSFTKKNNSENLGGISWALVFLVTNVVVIN